MSSTCNVFSTIIQIGCINFRVNSFPKDVLAKVQIVPDMLNASKQIRKSFASGFPLKNRQNTDREDLSAIRELPGIKFGRPQAII